MPTSPLMIAAVALSSHTSERPRWRVYVRHLRCQHWCVSHVAGCTMKVANVKVQLPGQEEL